MTAPLVFTPVSIRDVILRNRVVVPPMHQYSAIKGFPTDWHVMNAGKFAAGGAGLVIVETTKVERGGCGTVGDLGIWNDVFIKVLKAKGVDVVDCSSGGMTDVGSVQGGEIRYSYQVPLAEYVRKHAEIMTMAVGLIIHSDQAEQILQNGKADRQGNPQQSQLANGCLEIRPGTHLQERAAAVRRLTIDPCQMRVWHETLDVADRP